MGINQLHTTKCSLALGFDLFLILLAFVEDVAQRDRNVGFDAKTRGLVEIPIYSKGREHLHS